MSGEAWSGKAGHQRRSFAGSAQAASVIDSPGSMPPPRDGPIAIARAADHQIPALVVNDDHVFADGTTLLAFGAATAVPDMVSGKRDCRDQRRILNCGRLGQHD